MWRSAPAERELLQSRQSLREAVARHLLEIRVDRVADRHVEVGQEVLAFGDLHVAALGDAHRVGERVRVILERLRHLLGGLQEELLRVVAQALGIAERLGGADAEQDVVRVGVRRLQIVHVVGADHRQPEILCDRRQAAVHEPLLFDAVPLHLEEEVVRAEDVAIRRRRFYRLPILLMR